MGVMVSKRKRAVVAVQAVTKFSQPLRSVNESVCETTEVTDLDKRNGMPEEREDSSMSPLKEDQTPGNSRKSTQSTLISSDSNANFIHRLSVQSNAGMSCKG